MGWKMCLSLSCPFIAENIEAAFHVELDLLHLQAVVRIAATELVFCCHNFSGYDVCEAGSTQLFCRWAKWCDVLLLCERAQSLRPGLAKEADAHVWGAVISDWVLDFSSKPVFEIITEYITKIIQTNYHKQIVSNVLN